MWTRRAFRGRLGAVLAIGVLAGVAYAAALLDPPPPPIAGAARASDGDSFRLLDERVRLLGLDAPELAQTCDTANGGQWPCGRAARDRLAELLGSGRVDCQPEDHDQYGRLLATCSVGGRDLGRVMVEAGLALSSGRYAAAEQSARSAQRGIWSGSFETPRNWRDDHPRPQGAFGWLGNLIP